MPTPQPAPRTLTVRSGGHSARPVRGRAGRKERRGVEQLLTTGVIVASGHLAYVTQFEPAHRKRHREVVVTIVQRVFVTPLQVRYVILQATWDLKEPWWRRVLSWRRRRTTEDS